MIAKLLIADLDGDLAVIRDPQDPMQYEAAAASGDVSLYKEISRIYKDTTSQDKAAKVDGAGSFHAWLYAQRGIPSFATTVWGRPEAEKKTEDASNDEEVADEEDDDNAGVAGSWNGVVEIPEIGEMEYTLDIEQQPEGEISGTLATSMFSVEVSGTSSEATGSLSLEGSIGEDQTISISGTVWSSTTMEMGLLPRTTPARSISTRTSCIAGRSSMWTAGRISFQSPSRMPWLRSCSST